MLYYMKVIEEDFEKNTRMIAFKKILNSSIRGLNLSVLRHENPYQF